MALTEFVFKVRSDRNLLCGFTRARKGVRIVVDLLRPDAHADVRDAVFLILAPHYLCRKLLDDTFRKEYGPFKVLAEEDDYVSVQASLKIEYAQGSHNPIAMAFKVLGPDCIFHPIVVKDGFLHISVVSPNEEGRKRFLTYSKMAREHMPGEEFKLIHVGSYDPLPSDASAEGLTAAQAETLRMALALGYYDAPRACTIEDIAELFGISKAATHKRLRGAENKVMRARFAAPPVSV